MSGKCYANFESCSRGADEGWHICVPCYRHLETNNDFALLDLFKPKTTCQYLGCWNMQLEASAYCKGAKHQAGRLLKDWTEEQADDMIEIREELEKARRTNCVENFIRGCLNGKRDADPEKMEMKSENLSAMEEAKQSIDQMTSDELASIARYAIERIQEKLSTSSGDNRREKKRRSS